MKITPHLSKLKTISLVALCFVILSAVPFSCIESDIEDDCPPNCDTVLLDSLNYIWNTPFYITITERNGQNNLPPILYKGQVIFDCMISEDLGWYDPKLFSLDINDGKQIFSLKPNGYRGQAIDHVQKENLLLINYTNNDEFLICWNLENQSKEWSIEDEGEYIERSLFTLNDQIFYSEDYQNENRIGFFQVNIQNGKTDTLFFMEQDLATTKEMDIKIPLAELAESGDTIFYFQMEVYYDQWNQENRMQKLYCYNVSEKKIKWESTFFDLQDLNRGTPVVDEQMVFIFGGNKIVKAIDKTTGNLIWEKQLDLLNQGEITNTQSLIANGKLFVKIDENELFCISPADGSILWKGSDHGSNTSNHRYKKVSKMYMYEDLLYYCCYDANLLVVDPNSGDILIKEKSPFLWTNYDGSYITFDPPNDRFYFFDGLNAVAAEIYNNE